MFAVVVLLAFFIDTSGGLSFPLVGLQQVVSMNYMLANLFILQNVLQVVNFS